MMSALRTRGGRAPVSIHNAPRDWATATARDAISEQLAWVSSGATVGAALEALLAVEASHVLVREGDGGPVLGVISDFDLLAVLAPPPSWGDHATVDSGAP